MAVENVDCKDGDSIITYARVLLRQAKSAVAHLTAFQKICVPRAQCSKAVPPACLFLYPVRLVVVFSSKDTKSMSYPAPQFKTSNRTSS